MAAKDYDIRKRIRDYDSSTGKEPEDTYHSINLMVFLLGDIKYRVVYDDLERFLQDLVENVDSMLSAMPQKRVLQDFIRDLRAQLFGKSIQLRRLFQERLPSSDPYYFVVRAFRTLRQHPDMGALCLPFMNIQDGDPDVISFDDMEQHIKVLGKYSLYNLFYTKAKKDLTDLERETLEKARRLGIFSYPPTKENFRILDNTLLGGGSNHRTCDPNTSICKTSVSGWCNSDANGNCSAMSTDPSLRLPSEH